MTRIIYVCLAILTFFLSGCVATGTAPDSVNVTTDKTFGRYAQDLESKLILVTMTPEHHTRLTLTSGSSGEDALPPRYSAFLEQLNEQFGLTRVADWPLPEIDIYCIVFENQGNQSREDLVAALSQETEIESAQAVNTFEVQQQKYNDPLLSLQHGIHSIQAIRSHQWSRGSGVRVAIIDTGTDTKHPDLETRTETSKNFVDADEAGFQSDIHGTAVSGIVAASADNKKGMVGVAPDARLLALKACWHRSKQHGDARCNSLTLAKALNFSISKSVDVINLSLTGPPDPILERLVREAIARNIIVVGAQPLNSRPAFPVSVEGTIAVSMPDTRTKTIAAPGRRVLSTHPGQKYDFFDGSSFATAHITGLAAVVRSLAPDMTPAELLDLLERTSDPDTGVVNACRAVESLQRKSETPKVYNRCRL